MFRAWVRFRVATLVGVAFLVALALGVLVANRFAGPLPPRRIVMSTGREDGAYFAFALQYRRILSEHGFTLDIRPGPGSLETLTRLVNRTADVGFVQGGTTTGVDTTGLAALATVFYEPLWVFHRRALAVATLGDLKGRRVAVGEQGSGTRALALKLLADNHVDPANTTFLELPTSELEAAFHREAIDAGFIVASPQAPVVHTLLAEPGLTLMSERRDAAYRSLHPFLTSVRIGEGMVDMARNLPSDDKRLLAATASLVVRDAIHPDWIRLLLMAADRVHRKATLGDPAGPFPTEAYVELPISEQAIRYLRTGPSWLERRFPFWVAGTLDRLLLIVLPLLTLMLPLFGWLLPMMDRRQRLRIGRWYAALREIEHSSAAAPDHDQLERLRRLRQDIGRVRDTPPLHLGELYHLRRHVDNVLARLERRVQQRDVESAMRRPRDIGRTAP
jgi:uncharacterized protein